MSISPVSGFTPLAPTLPTVAAAPAAPAGAGTGSATGSGFADAVANGLSALGGAQADQANLAQQVATGDLTNVSDYMVAASQASLDTQLTVAVRDKAVNAFNQIMGMQL